MAWNATFLVHIELRLMPHSRLALVLGEQQYTREESAVSAPEREEVKYDSWRVVFVRVRSCVCDSADQQFNLCTTGGQLGPGGSADGRVQEAERRGARDAPGDRPGAAYAEPARNAVLPDPAPNSHPRQGSIVPTFRRPHLLLHHLFVLFVASDLVVPLRA